MEANGKDERLTPPVPFEPPSQPVIAGQDRPLTDYEELLSSMPDLEDEQEDLLGGLG